MADVPNRHPRQDRGPTYYGPCGRCEKNWTAKLDQGTPGTCRYCLAELKQLLESR